LAGLLKAERLALGTRESLQKKVVAKRVFEKRKGKVL